jgi:twitching motility protein PilT
LINLKSLLNGAMKLQASDIHLIEGVQPYLRIQGDLRRVDSPKLTAQDMSEVLQTILPEHLNHVLQRDRGVDFSYQLEEKARYRCIAFFQDEKLGIAMRWIPYVVPTIDDLEMPEVIKYIALFQRGLILVTGITGCGKSTTLAAMINHLNHHDARRVITVEDPIEYKFENVKCIISQREIGKDVADFTTALRQSLRSDPDVIMIGEMRDVETIRVAIKAAETGHLVISTLHTTNALHTVQRIIGHFPEEEHDLLRGQLSLNLKATITQRLVKTANGVGPGRMAAMEIMIVNSVVAKLIKDNRVPDIFGIIRSRDDGMQTIDQALADLVRDKRITFEQGKKACDDFYAYKRFIAGMAASGDRGAITAMA